MSTGAASLEHVHAANLRPRHIRQQVNLRTDDGRTITGYLSDFDQRAGRTTLFVAGLWIDVRSDRPVTVGSLDVPGGTR